MPKTIKIEPHLHSEELEKRYRKAHDPVLRSHYQILWLISEGKSTTQVMEVTGYSRGAGSNSLLAVTTPMAPKLWETVVTKTRALKRGRYSLLSNKRNSKKRSRSPHPMEGCGTRPR